MELARGESCTSGQRRGPAAPREDNVLSPDEKSFHTSTTPTTRGRKQRSPGTIPPRKVWKPQPHWVIADWPGLMEPACGESCPSGQRRGPVPPGDDEFPSPDQKSIQTTHKPRDENGDPPVRYRPARCGNPNPNGWLLIGSGSWRQRGSRVAPRANIEIRPHPGRIWFHPG